MKKTKTTSLKRKQLKIVGWVQHSRLVFPMLFALVLGIAGTYTLTRSHALTVINPPTNVSVTVLSPTSARLVWLPSTSTPAPGYSVFRDNIEVAVVNSWLSFDGSVQYTDSTLSPGTAYTYYIQAHNDQGTANSTPVTITTLQSPTASQLGIITGTVMGNRKVPIVNGTVYVSYNGTGHTVTTDVNGRYTLPGVPAGSYSVSAAATGFKQTASRVNVVGGQTVTLNFSLKASR